MAEKCDDFWYDNGASGSKFPTWVKLARHLMLIQPSSASSERVFSRLLSILKRPGMHSALIDLIEVTLMLQYNGKHRFGNEE